MERLVTGKVCGAGYAVSGSRGRKAQIAGPFAIVRTIILHFRKN